MNVTTIMNHIKYAEVYAWGKRMGSYDYYIEDEIQRCVRRGLPVGTIYITGEHYSMVGEIRNPETKAEIVEIAGWYRRKLAEQL